jgi:hypothetical protein
MNQAFSDAAEQTGLDSEAPNAISSDTQKPLSTASLWGLTAVAGFSHLTIGLVIFMFGCAVIIGLCGRKPAAEVLPPVLPGHAIPPSRLGTSNKRLGPWLNVAAAAGMLALAMVLRGNVRFHRPVALREQLGRFPLKLGSWIGRYVTIPPQQLAVLRANAMLIREYSQSSAPPAMFNVAYFAAQREGTAMYSPLHCVPGAEWEVARQSVLPISYATLGTIKANKVISLTATIGWWWFIGTWSRAE